MELKNREDIKNFIIHLEQKFQVNDWRYNDLQIWPLIRIWLYFHIIEEIEFSKTNSSAQKNKKNNSSTNSKFNHIKKAMKFVQWWFSLKKTKHLFVGAAAHRTEIDGVLYNKFYDPLIQNYKLSNFYLLEYKGEQANINHYHKSLHFLNAYSNFESYLKIKEKIKKTTPTIQLFGYEDFLEYLKNYTSTVHFATKRSTLFLENYLKNKFHTQYQFVDILLKKIHPKNVFMLCYYFDLGMILMAIANKKNISTIEMQHGPQTNLHLAYANWSKVPKNGYDVLPRKYWCWDEESSEVLKELSKKNKLYSSFIGGNPWFYFQQLKKDLPITNYILYTLQPNPVKISELFSEKIIQAIKNSDKKWLIRFHPRQSEDEKENILAIIRKNELYNTETEIANSTPLPILLNHCLINVTHFSGTVIEAEMFGKKSILLNEIGKQSFQNKIDKATAFYIHFSDSNLSEKLNHIVENITPEQKIKLNIDTFELDKIFR